MINSINTIQNIFKVYKTEASANRVNKPNEAISKSVSGDALALSDESRIKQKALQALKAADDIREDRVAELSDRIATGTYEISDEDVAEKLITDSLLDMLI